MTSISAQNVQGVVHVSCIILIFVVHVVFHISRLLSMYHSDIIYFVYVSSAGFPVRYNDPPTCHPEV